MALRSCDVAGAQWMVAIVLFFLSLCVAQAGGGVGQVEREAGASRAWEPAGSEGSPHPAGRSIGLCNGKLKAMSGEEVDGMEQEELADCIGKVGSSQGVSWGGQGGEFQLQAHGICSSVPLYPGVSLLQDQPKAQAQNHKGTRCASFVR